MKILAIIPARSGSKRLKNKNLYPLCGKPLIVHTLEQAKKCKLIDKIVVSTDGIEIANVSKKYCQVLMRPKRLAMDTSSSYDVIEHVISVLKKKGENYDIIILLEPTSPLRTNMDIPYAIEFFKNSKNEFDSLVSVGEIALEKPSIAKYINYRGRLKPITNNKNKAYFPYGVIYMSKTDKLLKTKTFYQDRTQPYIIERWQNYEVDDIYDLKCIETVMKYHGKIQKGE